MNISTGGPHILFFERDQQLATLLSSEFQLAGYECHIARTAVEVFDAIARYQARILLVNLAQAAAGRREFWVALDTQRRGRGVQVFTYQCKNIGSYGPSISSDDLDERSHIVKPDIEVDGMLGIMNLVEAVKRVTRPAGGATSGNTRVGTGTVSRISATPVADTKPQQPQYQQYQQSAAPLSTSTAPFPSMRTSGTLQPPAMPSPATIAQQPTIQIAAASPASSGEPRNPAAPPASPAPENIRAVIYPNQRSWSQETRGIENGQSQQLGQSTPTAARIPVPQSTDEHRDGFMSALEEGASGALQFSTTNGSERERRESIANGDEKGQAIMAESGLAQLSRMLEEQRAAHDNSAAPAAPAATPPQAAQTPQTIPAIQSTQPSQAAPASSLDETIAAWQATHSADPAVANSSSMSTMSLRASPIQDIPGGRDDYTYSNGNGNSTRNSSLENRAYTESWRSENSGRSGFSQSQPAAPLSALPSIAETPIPVSPTPPLSIVEQELSTAEIAREIPASNRNGKQSENSAAVFPATKPEPAEAREERLGMQSLSASIETVLQEQTLRQGQGSAATTQTTQTPQRVTTSTETSVQPTADTTLLDIMQSLPPMSSPPPQAAILNGRATRSLGSVLLEGHLVPQDRLEVAHNIQRMLRGVDMNYQLGEILLMFKLLTPDQLLAASLVSYGLLTTAQIRALGRIRQELHSIGLEYDLENLLILFRILSPEQLREVRASWST